MKMRSAARQDAWDATAGRCFYCRRSLIPDDEIDLNARTHWAWMHLDHKIPIVRGGQDIAENRIASCGTCNGQKGPRTIQEYRSHLLSLGVVPRFLDDHGPDRDWMLVATVRATNWPSNDKSHPYKRRETSA